MNEKYNGWTNYATWKVNLEVFDPLTIGDFPGYEDEEPTKVNIYELSLTLKEFAENLIFESGGGNGNIAVDYALAFLSDVDWYEIASCIVEKSKEEAYE